MVKTLKKRKDKTVDIDKIRIDYKITPDDFDDPGTYLDLCKHESCLDGYFKSDDLRRIADAMDALEKALNS